MKYRLTLSEKQMQILQLALEEYFRIRLNQWSELADDLAFTGLDYKNHTKEDFNERIERRDMFRDELGKLLNIVHPLDWCVDAREPMPMTDEPLPKMERVEE